MKRSSFIVSVVFLVALGLVMCGVGIDKSFAAKDPKQIIIRIGHVSRTDNPRGVSAEVWKKGVEARTKGQVKVEIYPAGQLGHNIQMEEAVLLGSLDGTIPTTAFTFNITPVYSMFDLPFLFSDQESVVKFLNSKTGTDLLKAVEPKGYKVLAMWPTGFKWLTANKPIHSVADLKGLKVRVMASDVLINQYKSWSASATPLPLPSLYNALAQGTIDAEENTFGMIHDRRLYEPQKYLIESNHSLTMDVLLVNKRWFDKLSKDMQVILVEEAQKITDQRWRWEMDRNAKLVEKIKGLGKNEFIKLSDEAKKEFRQMAQPTYDAFVKANPSLAPVLQEIMAKYN